MSQAEYVEEHNQIPQGFKWEEFQTPTKQPTVFEVINEEVQQLRIKLVTSLPRLEDRNYVDRQFDGFALKLANRLQQSVQKKDVEHENWGGC